MKTVILTGIPGSGKSSVLREIANRVPYLTILNYGDEMLREAYSEEITRDLLRKMPFKEQQRIGINAAKNIMQQERDGPVIIDTHALIRTPIGYCPGLPLQVLQILAPEAYVMVECLPHVIMERRKKDRSRARDEETINELRLHSDLTRSFLTACCMQTGSLFCIVRNNLPTIDRNILPFVRLLESIAP